MALALVESGIRFAVESRLVFSLASQTYHLPTGRRKCLVSLARPFTYPHGEEKGLVIVHTMFRFLPHESWGTIL